MKKGLLTAVLVVGMSVFFSLPEGSASAEGYVILDPGHGGEFKGTTGYSEHDGFLEKEANLSVGLRLREILQSATDLKVYMTRETDRNFASEKPEDLARRVEIANSYAAGRNDDSIFISIHHNFRYDYGLYGAKTFYYDDDKAGDPDYPPDPKQLQYTSESRRLANIVQSSVVNDVGVKNQGVHGDRAYFVIRNAQMPAVLAELGYMSNPQEEARIRTKKYRWKEAAALADAIGIYFHIWPDAPVNIQTVKGDDRIHTAVAVSQALYPNGFSNGKSQKIVILARSDKYVDA
ncbi:MAG TPA: N-acetylmuramoyl-L-alanine amidase, partial [Bacillales bacterium]|nr:N-acetylmuramoyl-L-alanine amidase [Bacillales bacterium]